MCTPTVHCPHMNKPFTPQCPYLAAAPSSERLARLGGSRARLVRTPQAEKHTSVLFESSSVITNWCTGGGEREREMTGRLSQERTKRGRDKCTAITRVSGHVYTDWLLLALQISPAQTWHNSTVWWCDKALSFLSTCVLQYTVFICLSFFEQMGRFVLTLKWQLLMREVIVDNNILCLVESESTIYLCFA